MASVKYLLKLPTVTQGVLKEAKTNRKHYEESRKQYSFFVQIVFALRACTISLEDEKKLLVSYLFQFVFENMVLPLYVPLAALIRFIKFKQPITILREINSRNG